ncbi:MAG: serpin family protein [Bacteroidales bacterium]|nr:serpin family protein [Bacteroidales bacterium]
MKYFSIFCLMTMLIFSSCSHKPSTDSEEGSRTGFSMNFFRNVLEISAKDENVSISPYSAGVALSMLASGAEGETLAELESALNHCRFVREDLGSNDSVIISSANALWMNRNFPAKKTYVKLLSDDFDSYSASLDFSSPGTLDKINQWCSDNTHGRIPKALDELDADMVAVLTNALYFKGLWYYPFNKELTRKDDFHGSLKTSKVEFMEQKQKFEYASFEGNQVVRLPYAEGRYAMTILLPSADIKMSEVTEYITEEGYNQLLSQLRTEDVVVKIPKFKVEKSLLLNSVLQNMGASKVFTRSAELGGITDADVLVSEVNQKTFVEINEKGAEAAAVTTIGVRLTAIRPVEPVYYMTIDRPFFYLISDVENGNILFAGRIMNL